MGGTETTVKQLNAEHGLAIENNENRENVKNVKM